MSVLAVLTACRWLHLSSLMMLFGSAVLLLRLRGAVPELGIEGGALRTGRIIAALVTLPSALAWFCLTVGQMAGDPAAAIHPPTLWLAASSTLFGQILLARLLLLLGAAAALLLRRETLTALFCAAALALISVTSHAAAASPAHFTAFGIVSDAVHLLCGGFWIGGLCVLASILAERPEAPRLAQAVNLFAEWGMIAVALLVLSGMLNSANILLGGAGHATALYLGVLGAKLVLVAAMIALALNNHFVQVPKLPRASATFRSNTVWELGLGLGVILLAGLLGMLQPTL